MEYILDLDNFRTRAGWISPNSWDEGENGILFLAYLQWYNALKYGIRGGKSYTPSQYINAAYSDKRNYFRGNPPEDTEHFSVDNMTGLYAIIQLNLSCSNTGMIVAELVSRYKQKLSNLPVFKWNNRWWLHPNGWMIFLSCKSSWFKGFFYIPILFMAMYSALTSHWSDTSGFNLWWLRLNMLGLKRTAKLFDWIITARSHSDKNMDEQIEVVNELLFKMGQPELVFVNGYDWSLFYYFTNGWNPSWVTEKQLTQPVLWEIIS